MINKGMTHYIALHTVNVIQVCLYISVIIIYCLQRLVLEITISLKKCLMSSYIFESINAVAWGITHEEDVLKMYEHEFGASVQHTGNTNFTLKI